LSSAIAVHSYKGGTGKTCVTTSIAAQLAMDGKNVCLLEYDFRGPSLYSLFGEEAGKYRLNDFLDGYCDFREALTDISDSIGTKGKLRIGLADPDPNRIQEMLIKDRKWERKALQRILRAKEDLFGNLNVEYLIFDTSPGLHYSSINAIAASNLVVLITKVDAFDMGGTNRMVPAIYELLKKKVGLVINQVVPGIEQYIELLTKSLNITPIGQIPLFADESMYLLTKNVMPISSPKHPFTAEIKKIIRNISKISSGQ